MCCYTQCMPLKNDPNELTNVVRWNSHHHHIKVNQLDMLYFAFLDLVARTDQYFSIFYQYFILTSISQVFFKEQVYFVNFAVNQLDMLLYFTFLDLVAGTNHYFSIIISISLTSISKVFFKEQVYIVNFAINQLDMLLYFAF